MIVTETTVSFLNIKTTDATAGKQWHRSYRMSDLDNINSPADLRALAAERLPSLAAELRNFIVEIVSREGGHLSASLGVIELTLAIHRVFDTPEDKLVWDVGHQAYGHKILTGRKHLFHTNRKYKGISGFPEMSESEYDAFGTGHSSTSVSAALGMAVASKLSGHSERQHIAVIGDGALTGGMAFEALNQAGSMDVNLLVILNDNDVSIDENVGALKDHLADLRSGKKNGQNIFESLGFHYDGPVDGHDLFTLIAKLGALKEARGPRILHCITKKGKGYPPAESGNAVQWHAPGIFDPETGKVLKPEQEEELPKKYQDIFGNALLRLAKENKKIIGVTPAMPSGSSMNIMMKALPERTFDVDIAEQHAVTFSAGLAAAGYLPFCSIYSTFLQRAYDQLIHDVARQKLKVVFCLDRAGLVGEDGATHHGVYDLAFLRSIPNLIIAAPMNAQELWNLMYTAQLEEVTSPFVIRYPRGRSDAVSLPSAFQSIEVGKGQKLSEGRDLAVISIGNMTNVVSKLIREEQLDIGHYDLRFLKPLDETLLHEIGKRYPRLITVEDGCIAGGMGSAILEFMADHGYHPVMKRMGIPDRVIPHGSQEELYRECALDPHSILTEIRKLRTL